MINYASVHAQDARTMLRGSEALQLVWNLVSPTFAEASKHPLICLTFQEHSHLATKPFSFANIVRSDALTLENLRELTACRAQAYDSANLSIDEKLPWQVCTAINMNISATCYPIDAH